MISPGVSDNHATMFTVMSAQYSHTVLITVLLAKGIVFEMKMAGEC